MEPVSPYLLHPLRGLREACFEIARTRGDQPPKCHGCVFEKRCRVEARCLLRRHRKTATRRFGRKVSGRRA